MIRSQQSREARKGAEIFSRFGSSAVQAPLIAEALYAQGRFPEAARALETAGVESGPAIASVAGALAHRRRASGDLRRAGGVTLLATAQAAVELAERTDDLNLRGDAFAALADALLPAGRPGDSADAVARARAFYDAKGNLVAAAMLPMPARSSA